MNWIHSRIGRSPRLAIVLGKVLLLAGAILVVGAVFARAGLVSMNADRVQTKLPAVQTLAQAYPQYPTELVPEGPAGFTIAALLVLAGTALISLAETAVKRQKERRGTPS